MNPVRPLWHYCYVLKSEKNEKFYTGVTGSLKLRVEQHNEKCVRSTKHMAPLQLIYFEGYLNKDDAYRREKYLPRLDFSNIWRLMKSINCNRSKLGKSNGV